VSRPGSPNRSGQTPGPPAGGKLAYVSARRAWAIGGTLFSLAAAFVLMSGGAPLAGCYQCDYPCPSAFDVGGYCLTPSGSNQPSTCLIDGQPVTQCDPGSCPPWTLSSGDTLTIPVGSLWPTLGPRDDLHWFVACLPPSDATLEASVPESSAQEASVPESSLQEASVPESSTQETSVSESSVQDASTQDASTQDASTQDASQAFISAVPQMAGTLTVLFDGVPAQGCICTPNTEITCARVLPTVQTIGFRYVQAPATPVDGGPEGGADAEPDSGSDAGQASLALSIDFDVGDCLPSHTGCPQSDVPEGSAY
jgi:hypothetical protein